MLDSTQILTPNEIAQILADLDRRGRRHVRIRQNAIIFRLATYSGLRASEIAALNLADLVLDTDAPYIRLRKATTKRHKARNVPLAWVEGQADVLRSWKAFRTAGGARPSDPVVCTLQATSSLQGRGRTTAGTRLNRQQVWRKFRNCLRCLSTERRAQLHTHSGRHTFGSYAASKLPLAAVRDALGHSNIATTSIYLHVTPDLATRRVNIFEKVTDSAVDLAAGQPLTRAMASQTAVDPFERGANT